MQIVHVWWLTYSTGQHCDETLSLLQHPSKLESQEDVEVDRPQLLGGADAGPERHHAGDGEQDPTFLVEGLDLVETIDAWVITDDTTVNVVITLSEVHGSSRGVASHLPYQLCRCVRVGWGYCNTMCRRMGLLYMLWEGLTVKSTCCGRGYHAEGEGLSCRRGGATV